MTNLYNRWGSGWKENQDHLSEEERVKRLLVNSLVICLIVGAVFWSGYQPII